MARALLTTINDRETRRYNMFANVRTFGVNNAAIRAAKTAFVAHEIDPSFVQHFADDRDAILNHKGTRRTHKQDRVEDNGEIDRLIRASMVEVNYLDAIVHNKFTRVPGKVRAWLSASHLERAPEQEKKKDKPATDNGGGSSSQNPPNTPTAGTYRTTSLDFPAKLLSPPCALRRPVLGFRWVKLNHRLTVTPLILVPKLHLGTREPVGMNPR